MTSNTRTSQQGGVGICEGKSTDVYKAYADSPITNTPAEAVANGHGIEDVGEATPLFDNIWVEVKGGN
ncbi:hypothetical protein [Candidatus Villigracilis saccharophilus]|uniref:hypothetical protein n=1 Tax=Candidatus Villigracilis saccharophilus TaxID=3140684 RepID=UPI003135F3BB|nr:hypothetical protein [Anaerolineales bacterium]